MMASSVSPRLLSTVQGLFANKLQHDDREPCLHLSIPGMEGTLALFLPKMELWIQLCHLLVMQTILACLLAVPIYHFIVKPRKKQRQGKSATTPTLPSLLFGFGAIMPLASLLPYLLLEVLNVHNRVLKMSTATVANVVVSKCLEAMYGTTTAATAVEANLSNYVWYYSSLVNALWKQTSTSERTNSSSNNNNNNNNSNCNGPLVRVTSAELCHHLWTIACQFCIVSIVLSYLMAHDFQPFGKRYDNDDSMLSLDQFTIAWKPADLANNYLIAILTFYTLCVGFNLTGLVVNLEGYSVRDFLTCPLFRTLSPSDFWAKRWNPVIGGALKRSIFLPVRQYANTHLAILATFVASGLLHDYTWSLIFYHATHKYDEAGHCVDCYRPMLWKQSAFFVYCGATMLLEKPIAKTALVSSMSKRLPLVIKSTLVVLTVLPVSHWYTGDWIVGGYFEDFQLGLFKIVRVMPTAAAAAR